MKTISVGELRQNPSEALAEVERGATYVVTRHRRPIARLVPAQERWASGEELMKFAERYKREHAGEPDPFPRALLDELRSVEAEDPWEQPWKR
ncbi:MAG: type II toxin-antitoxin system prevent-host-death family antitoxin [Bifidobacteriaceae bacterium]|jgi:prevent-host-death family protein|nr:type II toxin-antitoxin system prevent-host-death family antitoxin [Bifidobacteriaceae bacterium]